MSIFEDSAPLDTSASPGLAPLPSDAGPSPGLEGPPSPAPVTDRSTVASPSIGLAAQPTSGLGLADYKSARSDDDVAYLHNLPTMEKVGLMLQSFGAGVHGQPNPIDALLANKQKREAEFRAELGTTLQTVKTGIETVKKVSDPKARAALIEQITRAAGPNGALIRDALMSAGTGDEQAVKDVVSVIENPSARALLIQTAMHADDPKKEALRLMTDSDFMKRLEQRADQTTLPSVTSKMVVLSRAMAKMPQYKDADGNATFTMSDLREQNKALPQQFQLTDAELGTINRNQPALIPYGLRTDKTLQDEQSAVGKRNDDKALSDTAKLRADLAAGRITPGDFDKAMAAKDNKIVIQNQQIDKGKTQAAATAETTLDPQAIQDAAGRYRIDGTLPPNLGRGAQGAANTAKILNQAAADAKAEGDTSEESRIRQIANKANTTALGQLTKQEQMVGAFERNATRNADIALANSAKVDRTGVPVVNRWILAGMKEVAGDKDVATFHQANSTFVNEYAKIMSGSMGNTAVTDSLRKEAESMLSTAQTPEQYKAVVAQMKVEMGNRMKGFAEQKQQLTSSMSGRSSPVASTSAAAPKAAAAAPAPTNAKGWKLMTDKNGNKAYVSPDGKQYEEVK